MSTAGTFHNAWHELPLAGLDTIIGPGTCLILAPHPDDESLGCGGLIAACVSAGRPPLVAILTDGTGSHPHSVAWPPHRLRALRAGEALTAVGELGLDAERLALLHERDTAAPHGGPRFEAVVAALLALVDAEPHCTAILAPWKHDPHGDHQAAALAAAAVARAAGIRHVDYPVWGWSLPADTAIPAEPGRGWRLDISPYLAAKQRAIRSHRSQYGGLITDDPTGFSLPPGLLDVFGQHFETFLLASPVPPGPCHTSPGCASAPHRPA